MKERMKRLLTVQETAHFLAISDRSIYNGVARKAKRRFPVRPIRVGRPVLFDIDDLQDYVDSLKAPDSKINESANTA